MASAFGHAFAAIALGTSVPKTYRSTKFWILAAICSILPDADVIGFSFGIPYESFWGHRGFSHSLLAALLIGMIITIIFYSTIILSKKGILLILFFTLATASHAVLDAMTTGGLGIAFFSPWDDTRHFFDWRPIQVSPIGIENFFSKWGLRVIMSELIYIFIPGTIYIITLYIIRKLKK
ncbi:hydrolase [Dokdonia pacifica]|uniref:Inner membrane protein n=1 Tax=Dokdonia pacifica TaxID=1627892 RepID=A0A239DWF7_9FLAO|nr:metal-dependent hydrolase [Dokdonia pacifica]GGG41370.1 hydrolase [Dokdonia pacifica]SNS36677.1 inner membrane protein [Dokdonia pacifica]